MNLFYMLLPTNFTLISAHIQPDISKGIHFRSYALMLLINIMPLPWCMTTLWLFRSRIQSSLASFPNNRVLTSIMDSCYCHIAA